MAIRLCTYVFDEEALGLAILSLVSGEVKTSEELSHLGREYREGVRRDVKGR